MHARRRTRRQFLTDTLKASLGVAALAVVGTPAALAASDQQPPRPLGSRPLHDSVVESAEAFARGRGQGSVDAGPAGLRGTGGGQFTSGEVALPFVATHLGLHWVLRAESPEAVAVAVRTSTDRRRWSEWYPLEIEAIAARSEGREVFAALAPGEGGAFVQYRLTFLGAEALVEQMAVSVINVAGGAPQPEASATLATVTVTPRQANLAIQVVPREGWGCDEEYLKQQLGKTRDQLWPEMYVPVKKVIVHHTATGNTYTNGAAEVKAVWLYHAIDLGWGDIGYNALIDKYGQIYEGRCGRVSSTGREIFSPDVTAGHCYYHNYGTAGVSAVGNYDRVQPSQALKDTLDHVTAFLCYRHYIEPHGVSDFLQSTDDWHLGMNNVSGHYESYSTACPGRYLKSYLPTLRDEAKRLLGTTLRSDKPLWGTTPERDLLAGANADFSWSGAYGKYYYCFEGWYKQADSEDVDYLSGQSADLAYGPLAVRQTWTGATENTLSFPDLGVGHYTLHLRGDGGLYAINHPIRVSASNAGAKPSAVVTSPAAGAGVSGTVTIAVAASDTEDLAGDLHVFVGAAVDVGGAESKVWRLARYNAVSGLYEADWDTSDLSLGSQYTVEAHVTDSAGNAVSAAPVTVSIGQAPPPPGETVYVHVGDLDGSVATVNKKFWTASVTVTVHYANCQPVNGAKVDGNWNGAKSGSVSGTTGTEGTVTVSTGNMSTNVKNVAFTVTGISGTGITYDPSVPPANHDPESDSNGTSITLNI
ncbi:MAG: peptidoglycan recognition protein family protein [Chloroflexota bacterium]